MSSSITECPGCYTRFKVSAEQLTEHNGIVRCGLCSAIFNATEHLHDDEPSPQLTLPIDLPEHKTPQSESAANTLHREEYSPLPVVTGAEELQTLFQQIETTDESAPAVDDPPAPKQRRWPWIVGSLILILAVIAQGTYFFRVELAARLPGLKPVLFSYCELLKCAIPLPQKVELMSIDSSDLVADQLQPSVINLTALLHNRADYVQAYPNLELSLTDLQDRILARRTFNPSEYLKPIEDEKRGLSSNREVGIQLHLDTADLKPAGYKLLLYYP